MEVTSHLEYRFSSIGHPAVWDNCIAAARSHAMYISHVIRLRYCTRTRTSGHGLLVCQNSGGILPEVLGLLVLAFWWISKFSARTRTRTLRPNSGSGSGDYPTSGKHWSKQLELSEEDGVTTDVDYCSSHPCSFKSLLLSQARLSYVDIHRLAHDSPNSHRLS